jgi:hypothetical protein
MQSVFGDQEESDDEDEAGGLHLSARVTSYPISILSSSISILSSSISILGLSLNVIDKFISDTVDVSLSTMFKLTHCGN